MTQVASAIDQLTNALAVHGMSLDVPQVCSNFSIPVLGDGDGDGKPDQNTPQLKLVQSTQAEEPVKAPEPTPAPTKPRMQPPPAIEAA